MRVSDMIRKLHKGSSPSGNTGPDPSSLALSTATLTLQLTRALDDVGVTVGRRVQRAL